MIYFSAVGVVMIYIGGNCLYMYYRHGFHPPNDARLYRNSSWFFVVLGLAITVGSLLLV